MNKVAYYFVQFYRATFSYFLGGNCRYYPSCSCYALEAYEKLPFWKATWLTFKRVLSCHPLTKNKPFFDPVPLNFQTNTRGIHESTK